MIDKDKLKRLQREIEAKRKAQQFSIDLQTRLDDAKKTLTKLMETLKKTIKSLR